MSATVTSDLVEAPPVISDHQLLRCIGRGSYGQVWLGRNMMGAWRAVKVIYQGGHGTGGSQRELAGIRKFEPVSRESQGLVHILQVGQDPAQRYFYYVMELADDGHREEPWSFSHNSALRGDLNAETFVPRTLALERRRRGRLPAQECLQIALALAGALSNLHEHGLVHRDIKPANIIFVKGVPKLADIGLVAEMSEASSYVGTEGYIAPEGPNSPQGDIYSLGKVLYEIATGKDRQDFPEPITVVEPEERRLLQELNAVILKACAAGLSDRYQSAQKMLAELKLIEAGRSVRSERRTERTRRWLAYGGVTAVVLTLLAFGAEKWLDSRVTTLQGESTTIRPALVGKVSPRQKDAPENTVDLSAYYNAPLTEFWYPGPTNNSLDSLPRGLQNFEGVNFDVRGLIQLTGREIGIYQRAEDYPRQIRGIPVDRWAAKLHFLQGAVSEVTDGGRIGHYLVEYASGRSEEIPVVYGRDVRALWQPEDSDGTATNSTIAWSGQNPATRERQMVLRIYKTTWKNPWPDDQVLHVDFFSRFMNSAPFLVALSYDPHQPAETERMTNLNTRAALQAQAETIQQVQPSLLPEGKLANYKLKVRPAVVAGRHYDGFRFTAPAKPADLVWAFDDPGQLGSDGWNIVPVQGAGLKVGFEDWYHGSTPEAEKESSPLRVQFLAGKKLEPGAEYMILFNFHDSNPGELKACFRFAPPGEVNPNRPETLVRALGLQDAAEVQKLKFHRHYCLGGSR